jgi:hypothetical protein|tara:strand:- start:109 stop:582 length:474 start_codon:yes stop_codon:yes gene_type:complete
MTPEPENEPENGNPENAESANANPAIAATGDHLDQGEMRERQTARRSSRRRSATPSVSTIYWRDIPAQLTARGGDESRKVLLHARFQHAIDRAATVADLTKTDEYVAEWRTESAPLADGDINAQLDQLCADVEGQYSRGRLEAIVANGGLDVPITSD